MLNLLEPEYKIMAAVLTKMEGLAEDIHPPMDEALYRYARIPIDGPKEGWYDQGGPFGETLIPNDAAWFYSVHIIQQVDGSDELMAGQRISGPFISFKEATMSSDASEDKGLITCIYSALVSIDRRQLN